MPEYVYALHDFTPENPDEVAFKVGDRIEVIEKDDLYGDGWWQGRNPAGQTGLFPQSYTSPSPPSSSIAFPDASPGSPEPATSKDSASPGALHTLQEEPEAVTNEENARHSPTESERQRKPSNGDVMMRATLTDVQKAIEQLGRNDRDGARSFSFASSHGDYSERSETETDEDHDADAEDDGMGWHKDARAKLAERAQRENEQRQAREAEEQPRAMIPPINVEVSDESDIEDDESPHSPRKQQQYPRIVEEDEEAAEEASKDAVPLTPHAPTAQISDESIVPSTRYLVPDETDLPTATASTFPDTSSTPAVGGLPSPTHAPASRPEPEAASAIETAPAETPQAPTPSSPVVQHEDTVPSVVPIITPTPSTMKVAEQLPFSAQSALPSPTASSTGSYGPSSAAGIQQTLTPATTVASFKTSTSNAAGNGSTDNGKKPTTHPSEWTVDEVIEWLKSKGFDQGVCDKFAEQEITGDVLLELDANVLKSEIGIAAFGKRVRIVNAISELRRPPSISESEQHPAPVLTPRSLTHSFQYSISHHSHPSHSHSQSIQSSAHHSLLNSPMFSPPSPSVNGMGTAGLASITSPESPPHTGDLSPMGRNGWRASDPGSINGSAINLEDEARGRNVVGLGLGLPSTSSQAKGAKGRPAQLVLSPSDSALGEKVSAIQGRTSDSIKDERAVMSETESVRTKEPKSKRRLFGRSAESGSLKEKPSSLKDNASQHSGGTPVNTPPASASPVDELQPVRRRSKGNRSIDGSKPDRLSLFGASFTGTLGKHRKPPPRLSNVGEKPESEKHHLSTFSRFRDKRSTGRPGTSDGTVRVKEDEEFKQKEAEKGTETEKEDEKHKEKGKNDDKEKGKTKDKKDRAVSLSPSKERDPHLLRKRTSSSAAADHPTRNALATLKTPGVPTLKAGQSILEQIGTPDHNGWLRKKGDRYNSWKSRYFVLKGPHLYWLRSDSKSETKIKGYLNIVGYKVMADESVDPGRYGFRIVHDREKPHYFSSDEHLIVREWMKALMKATITRDYSNPVMSSCNIPTIPLTVAQAMNPAPRPPSPTARDATQKALRRENPDQLSSRDAQVLLMGMPNKENGANGERTRLESFFTNDTVSTKGSEPPAGKKAGTPKSPAPPRPSRELRRTSTSQGPSDYDGPVDTDLIEWANSHLPSQLQIKDASGSLCGGLALLRLAEDIRGKPSSPPVPDSAFPTGPNDDKLDGLFRLFDYLLDNDVKMGTVSINDIRQGKRDKIVQLLRALKAWEDKRKAIANSIGKGSVAAGPFMGMAGPFDYTKSL
ncbi:hypothetical protein BV20DRAFT_1120507 [Pilatotrama ljubarskyi]|nr:hypothetical protein BV20DRAFT_1120507 [Pilatotrama ljubarskyi]